MHHTFSRTRRVLLKLSPLALLISFAASAQIAPAARDAMKRDLGMSDAQVTNYLAIEQLAETRGSQIAKAQGADFAGSWIERTPNGEYQFVVEEPGTYVVEMAMVDGYVLALSNAGTLSRYETLQTVVRLPGRWDGTLNRMSIPQNPVNFLGMSAVTTMTATTLALAADMNVAPVDPGEPVSPQQP